MSLGPVPVGRSGMPRRRVLLSEGSSLTAREFATVLGAHGVAAEVVSPVAMPLTRFSRWCTAVHRVVSPAVDPIGHLRAVDGLMATGRFDALLATHEQAWLFAAGRRLLPHARMAIAELAAFDRVQSKLAFARLLDELGIPQPAWAPVSGTDDLDRLGFPVWVKAAYSTAGRGVRLARDGRQAQQAWAAIDAGPAMVQAPARGVYRQVGALFVHGRLVAATCSEQIGVGAGGSAAARLSVADPLSVDAARRIGEHLAWHGGITLDYLSDDGRPQFIECNPRTVEPGNAAAAGVDLPGLTIALARGEPLPTEPVIARPGVRTRSTMALALGAAEGSGTRRAILRVLARALARRPPLQASVEVLTPVLRDPPSFMPFAVAVGSVLARPSSVGRLAHGAVDAYAIAPTTITKLRDDRESRPPERAHGD